MKNTAVLLLSCPDRRGIVATVAQFLYLHNANILHADEHQDGEKGLFFLRVEWDLQDFKLENSEFSDQFSKVAREYNMEWKVAYSFRKSKVAIFVSHEDHCIADILYRHKSGDIECEI